jgi:hypothetical protein
MQTCGAVEWMIASGKTGKAVVRDHALQRSNAVTRPAMLRARKAAGSIQYYEDHPALSLLYSSAGSTVGISNVALTVLYLDLVGESFWLKVREGGVMTSAWVLPPTWVTKLPTSTKPWFEVQSQRWRGKIPQDDMIWFKYVDPADPFGRGTGIATTLANELDTDEAAAQHTEGWFKNKCIPPIIISNSGGSQNESEIRRFESKWRQKTQGFLRAHMPFFASRDIKVTQLAHTMEQNNTIPLRQFERDVFTQTWGIPPEAIGVIENSNRATIDAADYMLAKLVCVPRLEYIRAVLQGVFIEEFDERIVLMYRSPVDEDKEFVLQVGQAHPMALTTDDWRDLAGLEPFDNGRGQVVAVPYNLRVMRVDQIGEEPAAALRSFSEGDSLRPFRHDEGRCC